ncbi:RNA polymerase II-associated protein 1 [Diachasmimorpha longicaudata]|uniref:RNA polymerase II-associated protein 1 n=1 Tax=Diachasmimorpha longicaudata TaxID=58733 RepID=UPI0030B8DFB5
MTDPNRPKQPFRRPKPSDDEAELYRLHEEFLQSQQSPSARCVTSPYRNLPPSEPLRTRSRFAERRAMQGNLNVSTSTSIGAPINTVEEDISSSSILLGNIVEKKFPDRPNATGCSSEASGGTGFPEVFRVNKIPKIETVNSLFRQSIEPSTKPPMGSARLPEDEETGGPIGSNLLTEIHKENMEKLSQMTQLQILQEKSRLEGLLSPDVVKFLKSRKNSAIQSEKSRTVTSVASGSNGGGRSGIIQEAAPMETDPPPPPPVVSNLLDKASTSRWLHMDTVEPQKLQWMEDLMLTDSSDSTQNEPYNARFSFEGTLLPFKDPSIPMDQGLHHHGEEPERPGYTLQELLQLTRSSVNQQSRTALTTIASILEKSRKGWYDEVLEPAPLVALSAKNIFLLLRFSLDHLSTSVSTAALQGLREFLYCEADEICLDRLGNWKYGDGSCCVPDLAPSADIKDFNSLKDHELAQIDCVLAAVRTDIIVRMCYILSKTRPEPSAVTAILEILTRMARHSKTITLKIAFTPDLLSTITSHFLPMNTDKLMNLENLSTAYGVPNINALRLLRVLTEYGGRPVAECLYALKIMNSLLSYITNDPGEAGIRLSIEALRLWGSLLSQGVSLEVISSVSWILVSQLQTLATNHNLQSTELSSEHAAALITVSSYAPSLEPFLVTLLGRWSTQLENLSCPTWCSTKLVAITLTCVTEPSSFKCEWINNQNLFHGLILTSNLLSGRTTTPRTPECLPSLEALVQRGELQSVLAFNSCTPFLATAINFLCKYSMTKELTAILSNPTVVRYLNRLSTTDWSLGSNWFTRVELYFVTGLIKAMSLVVQNELFPSIPQTIAIKLLSTLHGDAPEAAIDLLKWLTSKEKLDIADLVRELNTLKLGGHRKHILPLNLDVSSMYEAFVQPGTWNQTVLPRDWPYLPLVASYTRLKGGSKGNVMDTLRIVTLLKLESTMPELFHDLSPTLRFSRLILIYFCDGAHLDRQVSEILKSFIWDFLKKFHKLLDFSNDIPGVPSFTDLFTALCEGFCANSHGDDGFAASLLAPVAQRHDKYYRKILWSEHAAALRYIKLTPAMLPVPVEEYLEPAEEDESLIEEYLTALVRRTVREEWSPLMYMIAVHHCRRFLKGEGDLKRRMRERMRKLEDKELVKILLEEVDA